MLSGNIGSGSDLDSFETELNREMLRQGIVDPVVKRDVQSRRERLQKMEDDDEGGYTSSKPEPAGDKMTSAQIRSMFNSLANGVD